MLVYLRQSQQFAIINKPQSRSNTSQSVQVENHQWFSGKLY